MNDARQPRILLGISGSIAAYKAAELIRRLRERGAEVQVVMTASAREFISPLSLQALAGRPVRSELFDPAAEAGMSHIELARWADQILIAPASANLIARLAHGLADDLLTTLVLASQAPVAIAPAMNQQMWSHPALQENVARLLARGVRLLGPDSGDQACGEVGGGRMREPAAIAAELLANAPGPPGPDPVAPGPLTRKPVLVTAGPTREALDPVRFIGNRSSGKMGYALAQALTELGAQVTLVTGPTALPPPLVARVIQVETALEMHAAVMEHIADCAIFVAAAAVADYRPEHSASHKLKKHQADMTLRLVRNPDILAEVAARDHAPFTLGFAAETDALEAHARDKLERKKLNMIAANRVGGEQGGFERDDNALLLLWRDGQQELPLMPKLQAAREIARTVTERYATSA
ncbi:MULTISPECIES: bifunctional phosphopantothenoylcysteine decarboxylase/phosphopantothenate--cysteine ligase CoaBC [Thiorhodovibrio]|uniref:bifunctional phosphopantothenoylcysteine decarboxylase/phosphopantothenate--cysteine ligase CoaBC n=1 Tax=Thiorhodovibrio TaxID=61593 RepID=UPI0019120121|nr:MULTISPECIES: bifunctional phosphopantothenoylcysteine decarboxylase/phosphopantothenate--cysteine ligase CoaBC [Thiorhodovibrio]MBK5968747.1 bifunctional 4'-phosphopantothenoylcysteine decarboxylase/phosphopantothenoylcysteine synthetase [Thiorhodovibrio winogradskyi]WPL10897.1 DNA/pantothenate metabolism flavoprotein [Thiorhodovibrio litoralis]